MDTELAQLESQLEQLITLYGRLKADCLDLRGRVARLEAENRQLSDRLERTGARIEAVLEKLPEA